MSKLKVVLFDLDNTLVDFFGNAQESMRRTVENLLGTVSFDEFWEAYVPEAIQAWEEYSRGECDCVEMRRRRLAKSLRHVDITLPDVASLNRQYVQTLIDLTNSPYDGVCDALTELSRSGYSLGILTNGFSDISPPRIEGSGISGFFDHVVLSESVGIHKPDPGIFEHTLGLFGVGNREAVYVGDTMEYDIAGARAAGMTGILFAPEEVPDEAVESDVLIFKHYSELPALVSSLANNGS